MEKIGLLTKENQEKSGIGVFEKQVHSYLLQFDQVEEVVPGPENTYPFSRTIQRIKERTKIKNDLAEYDKVFVPAQNRVNFDPNDVTAEIIPFVHDILPVTHFYKTYEEKTWRDRFSGYLSKIHSAQYMKCLTNCDKVLAASKYTKRDLKQRTAYSGKVDVVYQGVDNLPRIKDAAGTERDIDLLYVGGTLERKNPEFLKETLLKAEEKGFKAATVNFEEKNLPGETYTCISDGKLAELYSRARFYIHPSLAEGFGRGPVEAQRYGCIPLALDRKFNHEILGELGRHWRVVRTPSDALEFLEKDFSTYQRELVQENSEKYMWEDTVEQIAKHLIDDEDAVEAKTRETAVGEALVK